MKATIVPNLSFVPKPLSLFVRFLPYQCRGGYDGTVGTGNIYIQGGFADEELFMRISKLTSDVANITQIVAPYNTGDILHFKDYNGTSVYFTIFEKSLLTDGDGVEYFGFDLRPFGSNINYEYQPEEKGICVIEFLIATKGAGLQYNALLMHDGSGDPDVAIQYNEIYINGEPPKWKRQETGIYYADIGTNKKVSFGAMKPAKFAGSDMQLAMSYNKSTGILRLYSEAGGTLADGLLGEAENEATCVWLKIF